MQEMVGLSPRTSMSQHPPFSPLAGVLVWTTGPLRPCIREKTLLGSKAACLFLSYWGTMIQTSSIPILVALQPVALFPSPPPPWSQEDLNLSLFYRTVPTLSYKPLWAIIISSLSPHFLTFWFLSPFLSHLGILKDSFIKSVFIKF